MDLCSQKHDFGTIAEWVFFATSYCKSPCDGIARAVNRTCNQGKPLQRSLNNQILDYKAILDVRMK